MVSDVQDVTSLQPRRCVCYIVTDVLARELGTVGALWTTLCCTHETQNVQFTVECFSHQPKAKVCSTEAALIETQTHQLVVFPYLQWKSKSNPNPCHSVDEKQACETHAEEFPGTPLRTGYKGKGLTCPQGDSTRVRAKTDGTLLDNGS